MWDDDRHDESDLLRGEEALELEIAYLRHSLATRRTVRASIDNQIVTFAAGTVALVGVAIATRPALNPGFVAAAVFAASAVYCFVVARLDGPPLLPFAAARADVRRTAPYDECLEAVEQLFAEGTADPTSLREGLRDLYRAEAEDHDSSLAAKWPWMRVGVSAVLLAGAAVLVGVLLG